MRAVLISMVVLLTGCGRFAANHSGDPQSCRERAAVHVASIYPNPNDLHTALDTICQGNVDPAIPTTTRLP